MKDHACSVCRTLLNDAGPTTIGDLQKYDCPVCGRYGITGTALALVKRRVYDGEDEFLAILSYTIRRMQQSNEWPTVHSDLIDRIGTDIRLPNAAEQADNLVLWIGETQRHPGGIIPFDHKIAAAVIGAVDAKGAKFIAESLRGTEGLVGGDVITFPGGNISLTFRGWERYDELTRRSSAGPRAFMAMAFRNEILNDLFRNYFKPAVKLTGFDLQRLDEEPKAGFINNRLLVEIRRARFLVADLTDWNAGAYWEAGFAEGLGKPVIYTCEREIFKTKGTHFDTNHHQTVLWDSAEPDKAAEDLKATIRATLPGDARMDD